MRRFAAALLLGAAAALVVLWALLSVALTDALLGREGVGAIAAFGARGGEAAGESWYLTARDGVCLAARARMQKKDGRRWVILLHGYSSKKEHMLAYADAYRLRGYHVLLPDLRGHGESGGDYVGMGWLDRDDVLDWMAAIRERDPAAEIVLHGLSMGAAAALAAAGETPPGLVAVISDSAYTSLWDVAAYQAESFTGLSLEPLLLGISGASRRMAGYGWREAAPLGQMARIGVPTLLIHGGADRFVPVYMVYSLYAEASCPKALYIEPGAGHAAAARVDETAYWAQVFAFLTEPP